MEAKNLVNERIVLSQHAFAELVIWSVQNPLLGSNHGYKYRLALIIDNECVMRYDNEVGKGDHKHVGSIETSFTFTSLEDLLTAFWADVEELYHD